MENKVINQSVKTSVINYVGVFLGAIFTIYLAPKLLSSTYNGMYRLLMEYSAVLAAYFHFGIPSIINRFYYKIFENKENVDGFNFFVVIFPGIVILLFTLFLFFFRNNISEFLANGTDYYLVYRYIPFIIPLIFMYSYLYIVESYSAMLGNIAITNFCRNVLIKLFNIASLVVYAFTANFTWAMEVISFGCCVAVIISLRNLFLNPKFVCDFKPSLAFLYKNNIKKDFFYYLIYILVSNITLFLVSKIDIFFVGKYTSLSSLAYYTTALFFVTLIFIPYQAILNISFPIISRLLFEEKKIALSVYIRNYSLFGLIMAFYVFLLVWCNIDYIYEIIPHGNEYAIGKYVFLIIGIGRLIDIAIGSSGQLITVSKYYYLILICSISTSILGIVLGYYLVIRFGMNGAAFAVSVCSIFSAFFQILIVEFLLKIHIFDRRFFTTLFLAIFVFLFCYIVDLIPLAIWAKLVLNAFVITVLFFSIIIRFKLSNEIIGIYNRIKLIIK